MSVSVFRSIVRLDDPTRRRIRFILQQLHHRLFLTFIAGRLARQLLWQLSVCGWEQDRFEHAFSSLFTGWDYLGNRLRYDLEQAWSHSLEPKSSQTGATFPPSRTYLQLFLLRRISREDYRTHP